MSTTSAELSEWRNVMSQYLMMIRIDVEGGAPTGLRRSPRPTVELPPCDEQGQQVAVVSHAGSLEEATWEDAEWR